MRDISRDFHGGDTGLKHVDLDIADGEFLAIMGPSGAGKSTLLNIIGLLDRPSGGSYTIGNRSTRKLRESQADRLRGRTFSFVFQASNILPHETVERNAALGLAAQGVNVRVQSSRVSSALQTVGLIPKVGGLAKNLSGGERQRLAIARAIATRPRVLLADEPTGNLDAANSRVVMNHLLQLHREGTTVILITHDEEVAAAAETTVRIVDGELHRTIDGLPLIVMAEEVDGRRATAREPVVPRLVEALNTLTSRPARTAGLSLAFLLATAGLVASMGIGSSGAQQISDRLTANALDQFTVYNPPELTPSDVSDRLSVVNDIDYVSSVGIRASIETRSAGVRSATLASSAVQFRGPILAVDSGYLEGSATSVEPKAALGYFDMGSTEQIALVGSAACSQLGLGENPLGRRIWVQGRPYTIVGEILGSARDESLGGAIVLPYDAVPAASSELIVRTEPGYPAAVAEAVPLAISPSNPGAVQINTVVDYRTLRRGVASDLSSLLSISSIVLLAIATLSAAVAMYLSIQGRTTEIALRRAVGVRRTGIALLFLFEGALLGLAGATGGVALGSLTTVLVAALSGWGAVLPTEAVWIGLLAGLFAGSISSVLPALRAARISPALAIGS